MPVEDEQEGRRPAARRNQGRRRAPAARPSGTSQARTALARSFETEIEVAGKPALAGQFRPRNGAPGDIRPEQAGERPAFEMGDLKGFEQADPLSRFLEPVAELDVFDGRELYRIRRILRPRRTRRLRTAPQPAQNVPASSSAVLMDIMVKEILELRKEIPLGRPVVVRPEDRVQSGILVEDSGRRVRRSRPGRGHRRPRTAGGPPGWRRRPHSWPRRAPGARAASGPGRRIGKPSRPFRPSRRRRRR